MAEEKIPLNAGIDFVLQSIPVLERKASESIPSKAARQGLDRHFLADCLVKSGLSRTTPIVYPASSSKAQSQKAHSYECDICGKTFSSHQALGGHKSSHHHSKRTHDEAPVEKKTRKRPRCLQLFPASTTFSETECDSSSLDEEPAEGQIASSSNGPYECDICGKTFSAFQALGGHKSSHSCNNIVRTHHLTNTVKSNKRRTCLQLFTEASGLTTSTLHERESASSFLEEPGEIDLELRLGIMIK